MVSLPSVAPELKRSEKKRISDEDRKIELTGAWGSGMMGRSHISSADNVKRFCHQYAGFCVSNHYVPSAPHEQGV